MKWSALKRMHENSYRMLEDQRLVRAVQPEECAACLQGAPATVGRKRARQNGS